MQTEKFQPEGKRIMPETRFTEFPALSVDLFLLQMDSVSLASRLNGYMYSNGTSLNVALFTFVARITLQLLGVKIIP